MTPSFPLAEVARALAGHDGGELVVRQAAPLREGDMGMDLVRAWNLAPTTRIATSRTVGGKDGAVDIASASSQIGLPNCGACSLLASFRSFYGPTMNAFAAAEESGRADDLQRELAQLFESQNRSGRADATSIPATFLKVTVAVSPARDPRRPMIA